jgi:hypothetical protein
MVGVAFTASSSVVVNDLDVLGAGSGPTEADPPLPVYADAVRVGTIAPELLEPVPRWHPKITQGIGSVEDEELSQRHPLRVVVELAKPLSLPDAFCVLVAERPQHAH